MKNIHILPTDKPSRVRIGNNGNFVIGLTQNATVSKNDSYTNQNIYITSDEEIKEGDCFLPQGHINPHKLKEYNKINGDLESYNGLCYDISKCKKIILTTDQDLIKDGVQAIDDEFLEWFVKNPSCEEVEVEIESKFDRVDGHYHDVWEIIIPTIDWSSINPQCKQIESCSNSFSKKCICPKEETNGCIGSNGISDPKLNEVQLNQPKQETLEEAVLIYCENRYYKNTDAESFRAGAKWQKEQDKKLYSEEEVKEILRSYADWSINGDCTYYEWFEQFKKK